jgi:hypothetical protein
LQIPTSVSSEPRSTKRVRRATATPLMPPMLQLDPVFLKPIGGQRDANLVGGFFLFCSLARDHAARPPHQSHPVPPIQAPAVLCPASIALRSRHWMRKSGCQAPPTSIAGAKRFPISVCRTHLVCGLPSPSPGWAWRGRVRCRNGTLLAAPLRVTQGMMS